jgi:uncharacterized protein YbaR (Trm112 family)
MPCRIISEALILGKSPRRRNSSDEPRLLSILACPQCRHALHLKRDRLVCENCAGSFKMRDQTALFLPEPVEIVPAEPEHKSNPLGAEYEMILREGKKFVLNIGAGATRDAIHELHRIRA